MIGPVESPRGFGLQDHLCWVHGDPWDYRPRLTEFFDEGLERGLQVAYLGAGNVEELREHLDRFIDVGPLLTREDIRIISFDRDRRPSRAARSPLPRTAMLRCDTSARFFFQGLSGTRKGGRLRRLGSEIEFSIGGVR